MDKPAENASQIRLVSAAAPVEPSQPPIERLAEEEIRRLLSALPALQRPPAPVAPALPPPPDGELAVLPPPETRLPTNEETLTVVRCVPEGEVDAGAQVSVTFSQPMIALGTPEGPPPAQLSPQPPGRWRWLGTRTLVFEPEGVLTGATDYILTVPAGVCSLSGATLAEPVSVRFSTPPLRLIGHFPDNGPLPRGVRPDQLPPLREPLLVLRFDQAIAPEALLPWVRLLANDAEIPLRLATEEEIAGLQEAVREHLLQGSPQQRLLLRPESSLPADSPVRVEVAEGAPSAEGARVTATRQGFGFRTPGPLRVIGHKSSAEALAEHRWMTWQIQFSNPLARWRGVSVPGDGGLADVVSFQPALQDYRAFAGGRGGDELFVSGRVSPHTTYTVTVRPGLRDIYGGTLEEPTALTFAVEEIPPPPPEVFFADRRRREMVVLPRERGGRISLFCRGTDAVILEIRGVQVEHWSRFTAWDDWTGDRAGDLPGEVLLQERRSIAEMAAISRIEVDLSPWLTDGYGHFLVWCRPTREGPRRSDVIAWFQVTNLGLTALEGGRQVIGRATALVSGRPLPGAQLSVLPEREVGREADDDGLARFVSERANLLKVAYGKDEAFLPLDHTAPPTQEEARWLLLTDRRIYRPGEVVHLKGWLKRASPDGVVDLPNVRLLRWRLLLADETEAASGRVKLDPLRGFHLLAQLPDDCPLGYVTVKLEVSGALGKVSEQHRVEVREFRRPTFEIQADVLHPGPHIQGDEPVAVVLTAKDYTGSALASAAAQWSVSAKVETFSPEGWERFTFDGREHWTRQVSLPRYATSEGRTDREGRHSLGVDVLASRAGTLRIEAQATIRDLSRQAWTTRAGFTLHPAALRVGLRADRRWGSSADPIEFQAVVIDLEGRPVAGRRIQITASRYSPPLNVFFSEEEAEPLEVVSSEALSGEAPTTEHLAVTGGGQVIVEAEVRDDAGRATSSRFEFYLADRQSQVEISGNRLSSTLRFDRESYLPGEIAEVLIQSPLPDAEGLVSWWYDGLRRAETIRFVGQSYVLRFPIELAMIPELTLGVSLLGTAPNDPGWPVVLKTSNRVRVESVTQGLTVRVRTAEPALRPGAEAQMSVEVLDARGEPVTDASVALIVVDEAALAIGDDPVPDPLQALYPRRRSVYVRSSDLRDHCVLPSEAPDPEEERTRGGGRGGFTGLGLGSAVVGMPEGPGAAYLRQDFNPLALFAPDLVTDASGRIEIRAKLPDNLTRYRVTAVAVRGGQAGRGQSALTVRLPLMLRPSPPRLLRLGDTAELSLVLHNLAAEAEPVALAVRASGIRLEGGEIAGHRLVIPPGEQAEVRLPLHAETLGEATLQAIAVTRSGESDAVAFSFPVRVPATPEVQATYGVLPASLAGTARRYGLAVPIEALPGASELDVSLWASPLGGLSDLALALHRYPFGCTEQIASRLIGLAAVGELLVGRSPDLDTRGALHKVMRRDLGELFSRQNADGGWGFWTRGGHSWAFVSLHTLRALLLARAAGFSVAPNLAPALGFARAIDDHIPQDCSPAARHLIRAYAAYVQRAAGDPVPSLAANVVEEAGGPAGLPLEALGWLLPDLAGDVRAEALRYLNAKARQTAGSVHFAEADGETAYLTLSSPKRTDAVLLEGLLAAESEWPLLPGLARSVLGLRRRGWRTSTQESTFALLALYTWLQRQRAESPQAEVQAWLDQAPLGLGQLAEEAASLELQAPVLGSHASVTLAAQGQGQLSYRVELRYVLPADLTATQQAGFTVERTYEAVDDAADVQPDEAGGWRIRAGARVRVRLLLTAPHRRMHVALVDPLPASLEPIDPALLGAQTDPGPEAHPWWPRWYDHVQLRDDRAEVFAAWLPSGVYRYDYLARATTLGRFLAPSPRAEEMYAPETFGRGRADVVIVE